MVTIIYLDKLLVLSSTDGSAVATSLCQWFGSFTGELADRTYQLLVGIFSHSTMHTSCRLYDWGLLCMVWCNILS